MDDNLYYKHNRLQQLRGFCYAAQLGSISRAAEKMLLTQPSVSLQIQALERELDTVLFERKGPRIMLTPEGKTLLQLALPLVEGIEHLPAAFGEAHGTIDSGRLSIAAGQSTILTLLPAVLKEFSTIYPNIHIDMFNVTGSEGMARLRAGEADIVVGPPLEGEKDIVYRPYYYFDTVLITAKGHKLARRKKVTLRDIAPYPLILPPRRLTTHALVQDAFRREGLECSVRLEVGGWDVIKRYVEAEMGISIVSSICLEKRDTLAVVPLSGIFPRRTYGILIRRGQHISPQASAFMTLFGQESTEKALRESCPHATRIRGLLPFR